MRLTARVEPATPIAGQPVRLIATLANTSEAPVELFERLWSDLVDRESWILVDADGVAFKPVFIPFQTVEPGPGMLGTIVELTPGEQRTFSVEVARVVPVAPPDDGQASDLDPAPLREGRYTVRCSYRKKDATVPFLVSDFKRPESHPVAGLWTGTVVSAPVDLVVLPRRDPWLTIERTTRDEMQVGDPFPVSIGIHNPRDTAVTLQGAFVLRTELKAGPFGTARFRIGETVESLADGEVFRLEIPARSTTTYSLDLTQLAFEKRTMTFQTGSPTLSSPVTNAGFLNVALAGRGVVVSLSFTDEAGEEVLRSNDLFRGIRYRELETIPGIRIGARVRTGVEGPFPILDVALVNESPGPLRFKSPLAFPADLNVVFSDPSGRLPTRSFLWASDSDLSTLRGIAGHDSPHFRPAILTAKDFEVVESGDSLRATLDLSRHLEGSLPPGRYEVSVLWRNLERGGRFSFSGAPVVVGLITSRPVPFEVSAPSRSPRTPPASP